MLSKYTLISVREGETKEATNLIAPGEEIASQWLPSEFPTSKFVIKYVDTNSSIEQLSHYIRSGLNSLELAGDLQQEFLVKYLIKLGRRPARTPGKIGFLKWEKEIGFEDLAVLSKEKGENLIIPQSEVTDGDIHATALILLSQIRYKSIPAEGRTPYGNTILMPKIMDLLKKPPFLQSVDKLRHIPPTLDWVETIEECQSLKVTASLLDWLLVIWDESSLSQLRVATITLRGEDSAALKYLQESTKLFPDRSLMFLALTCVLGKLRDELDRIVLGPETLTNPYNFMQYARAMNLIPRSPLSMGENPNICTYAACLLGLAHGQTFFNARRLTGNLLPVISLACKVNRALTTSSEVGMYYDIRKTDKAHTNTPTETDSVEDLINHFRNLAQNLIQELTEQEFRLTPEEYKIYQSAIPPDCRPNSIGYYILRQMPKMSPEEYQQLLTRRESSKDQSEGTSETNFEDLLARALEDGQ
ncbi:nucleoprotein [Wenling dimarhabdovirus 1]|uniref:Nucleoprotein n=1 Tax=Wenling dimarhabdovirus 1 TaxID=2116359 RepID=A0A2P1GMU5_9RHAB|nr:nucleoprotein [Wenling dimarhabdovirus 1]